jgi:drug/metabolite transporter (DMT)-like permease
MTAEPVTPVAAEPAAPPPVASGRFRALLAPTAAGITVVLWASAFVGIRAAGKALQPGPLALARLLVGSVVLGAFVTYRREPFPARRDLPKIAACGVLWFGLWAYALARTSAGRLGVTTYLVPPISILLGWLILGEVPTAVALLGGALCLTGVAVSRLHWKPRR